MIGFTQLRCFVAVAEELHFRRAAARLNMTQPPLSRQIQLLEHELGAKLFERGSRGVSLTAAGEALLRDARRLILLAEDAARTARRIAKGEAGTVTIGFTAASSYHVLPGLVSLIREKLPEVALTLREKVSHEQIEALRAGQLDFGLLRPPASLPGIQASRVHREPLLVALPRDHPLAAEQRVDIAALDGQPLITYPPLDGRYLHDLVMGALRTAGISPGPVQHISQTHSILALVGAGIGIALVPQAAERFCPGEVVLRPLNAPAVGYADLLCAWQENTSNPARLAVLKMLRQEWPALRMAAAAPRA
jgi:DNA-binding transcriptional LysR family regulator